MRVKQLCKSAVGIDLRAENGHYLAEQYQACEYIASKIAILANLAETNNLCFLARLLSAAADEAKFHKAAAMIGLDHRSHESKQLEQAATNRTCS